MLMNDIQKVEYNGVLVLTTQQIADAYGTDVKILSNNFNRNKDRYIIGKHYICLEGDELKAFKGIHQNDESLLYASKLYLWTKKGTFLHAKSLNTDTAWEVYDRLVDSYFEQKQNIAVAELSPELQMFNKIFTSVARQELEQKRLAKEIDEVKQTQIAIADTFQKTDDTEDFQKWANNCIARIAESPKFDKGYGRSKNYSLARSESYDRLKQKRNCLLDDRVRKAIGRALENQPDIKKSELQKINKIYVIANDKDLRPAYELVIKEMMIYYCVKSA